MLHVRCGAFASGRYTSDTKTKTLSFPTKSGHLTVSVEISKEQTLQVFSESI